ncbi:unnamed protein product [Thelazia callipaeda]|uniref:Uncharacterized protein n=1 Tax=Thelazia callipaeda TaxID=103827 RepID=A0A0N5CYR7_THECL|nr:unnamed protein product [Thelazia callipaeda]
MVVFGFIGESTWSLSGSRPRKYNVLSNCVFLRYGSVQDSRTDATVQQMRISSGRKRVHNAACLEAIHGMKLENLEFGYSRPISANKYHFRLESGQA